GANRSARHSGDKDPILEVNRQRARDMGRGPESVLAHRALSFPPHQRRNRLNITTNEQEARKAAARGTAREDGATPRRGPAPPPTGMDLPRYRGEARDLPRSGSRRR